MRRALFALAGLAVLVAAAAAGRAQEPADPTDELAVTPAAGPWMIIVNTYKGPTAAELARGLCLEIRQKHRMPAYVYNRSEEERRKHQKEVEERRQQIKKYLEERGYTPDRPIRIPTVRIEPEYAVLMGSYRSMDAARRALDDVRKLTPPSEAFMHQVTQVDPTTGQVERRHQNPFQIAFVVPNPTVPMEKEANNKPDPLLKELNAGEKFSLLKNRKPWTLVVKVYQGPSVTQPAGAESSFLSKIGLGKDASDYLTATALQAHQVANLLRTGDNKKLCLGHDAYVLHMRYCSLVTVGGFDTSDDPQLLQLQRTMANCQLRPDPKVPYAVEVLSPNPLPMEVPRP